jgi:hypothetical protein
VTVLARGPIPNAVWREYNEYPVHYKFKRCAEGVRRWVSVDFSRKGPTGLLRRGAMRANRKDEIR